MRILGIDPGTVRMGYGLIEADADQVVMVDCGVVTASGRISLAERLHRLYLGLMELASRYLPEEVAVEEPFVADNVRSAMAIGHAQAVAMLVAAKKKLPIYSYSPAKVKQMVADYGGSDKRQVQEMVRLHLNLSAVPEPTDAADALAVALCHAQERRLARLMTKSAEGQ